MASASQNSSRAKALARRKAMSSGGKAAIANNADRTRHAPAKAKPVAAAAPAAPAPVAAPASSTASYRPRVAAPAANSSRAKALARRKAMSSSGKSAASSADRTRSGEMVSRSKKASAAADTGKSGDCGCGCGGKGDCGDKGAAAAETPVAAAPSRPRSNKVTKPKVAINPSKAAALARRKAQSTRGKAGISAGGMTQAQTARAANPQLSSRELAQAVREVRSTRGKAGEKKSRPCGRQRVKTDVGAAQDAPWKVGVSETSHGQSVTGTMVGRDESVTGDEASTCRTITGTEYLGADVFREFCETEPSKAHRRVGVSPTGMGNSVTGNRVGRSEKVTGDEPGTCKNVTGTEYVGSDQSQAYCGTDMAAKPAKVTQAQTMKGKSVTGNNVGRSAKVTGDEPGSGRDLTGTQYMEAGEGSAPHKVGMTATLRGGSVTGTLVGRSSKTTGDEPGSCRNVTGDDYIGQEQFNDFCEATPAPADQKVGVSSTLQGESVTGTMTGRSGRVTGDEPGTCKSITGTPYAGAEQYSGYCETDTAGEAAARMGKPKALVGSVMTGQQPSIAGVMTGDSKGACETVSGTPYVGADQFAAACPATAADQSSPDFPQSLGGTPWEDFSVKSPAKVAQQEIAVGNAVTGSRYEQGKITGPFDMAGGKVTGTEQARFGQGNQPMMEPVETAEMVGGRVKTRITGEGMDTGLKITGDDWDRNEHVTGTEGASATRRNMTQRGGPMSAMDPLRVNVRNDEIADPVSRVTGGSGNTDKGSLITYSGGARG